MLFSIFSTHITDTIFDAERITSTLFTRESYSAVEVTPVTKVAIQRINKRESTFKSFDHHGLSSSSSELDIEGGETGDP